MASLYIKDERTAAKVARVAARIGVTKTEAVSRAMDRLEETLPPVNQKRDFATWLAAWRLENPLPPPTGLKADKAFFDEMWGEDPV
ncbi:MAG: type II toxin-antitoxin system VapB family antitoxin [Pseudomonadota bacterium]